VFRKQQKTPESLNGQLKKLEKHRIRKYKPAKQNFQEKKTVKIAYSGERRAYSLWIRSLHGNDKFRPLRALRLGGIL